MRYPSPALRGRHEQPVESARWHEEPAVIASSQLMRRGDRAAVLLEGAEPWDLVVLDEAHHARRQAAGARWEEDRPNALLRLMRQLARRADGLLLLTGDPRCRSIRSRSGISCICWVCRRSGPKPPFSVSSRTWRNRTPSVAAMERMAGLFQAVERAYGPVETPEVQRLADLSRLRANRVLRALRDGASIPRRQLESAETARGARHHARPPRRSGGSSRAIPVSCCAAITGRDCWPRRSRTAAWRTASSR